MGAWGSAARCSGASRPRSPGRWSRSPSLDELGGEGEGEGGGESEGGGETADAGGGDYGGGTSAVELRTSVAAATPAGSSRRVR